MSDQNQSFDDFLSELSSSLQGESGEVALRRINTERSLRLILEEIVDQRHDVQIRILNDSRIAGDTGADILIQIDDYDVRVEIIDAQESSLNLSLDQIERFRMIFEDNPSTETLVITWTTENLKSIQLSLADIEQLTEHPQGIQTLIKSACPLADLINEILETRIKIWNLGPIKPQEVKKSVTDIKNLFVGHFRACLEDERKRSFKLLSRKAAAESISEKNSLVLFSKVLDLALSDETAEILAKTLYQFPKRSQE